MIDFKDFPDEYLLMLYSHKLEFTSTKNNYSDFIVDFIKINNPNISEIGIAFIPMQITKEMARRWYIEKTKYL